MTTGRDTAMAKTVTPARIWSIRCDPSNSTVTDPSSYPPVEARGYGQIVSAFAASTGFKSIAQPWPQSFLTHKRSFQKTRNENSQRTGRIFLRAFADSAD